MFRKLGVGIVLAAAVVGQMGSSASASTVPRSAAPGVISSSQVGLEREVAAVTGQAVESYTDPSTRTTYFTASCQVNNVVIDPNYVVSWWIRMPWCWITDTTTGQRTWLNDVGLGAGGDSPSDTAAGIVDGPVDHQYEMCVGFLPLLTDGSFGDPEVVACAPLEAPRTLHHRPV